MVAHIVHLMVSFCRAVKLDFFLKLVSVFKLLKMSKTYGSYFTSFKCILVIPGPYCFSLQNLTQNHLLLDANCTTAFGGPRLSLLCLGRFCSILARTAISEEFCPILWCESDSVYFPWPSHLGGFLPAGHWAVSVEMTRRIQKEIQPSFDPKARVHGWSPFWRSVPAQTHWDGVAWSISNNNSGAVAESTRLLCTHSGPVCCDHWWFKTKPNQISNPL